MPLDSVSVYVGGSRYVVSVRGYNITCTSTTKSLNNAECSNSFCIHNHYNTYMYTIYKEYNAFCELATIKIRNFSNRHVILKTVSYTCREIKITVHVQCMWTSYTYQTLQL